MSNKIGQIDQCAYCSAEVIFEKRGLMTEPRWCSRNGVEGTVVACPYGDPFFAFHYTKLQIRGPQDLEESRP